ncbi:tRNA 4-thiouridine(8) synthase ThiI [Candidatus Bathyarchaeota archaeon]|nr:tRNA 4-thiouridine(8) synthase ThiI [Candidatus Bathyarchaeota archaeon]
MKRNVVLVAYNEIALKSKPVRKNLEIQLSSHIQNMLTRHGMKKAKIDRTHGRLIIKNVDSEKAKIIISKVFGVASVMSSIEISSELDDITKTAVKLASQIIQSNQTFAVNARRIGDHSYTSKDVENKLGEEILQLLSDRGVKVDLSHPDKTVHIEIRNDSAYIYDEILKGPGGLTYGSQGKLISLFSGGIDSPVATWLMMKRGGSVLPLVIDQRPFVGEDYLERAFSVARKLREYVPLSDYKIYISSTGEVMEEIVKNAPKKFTCVLCKRLMYRVACHLALTEGAHGVVTGENLGQVASQTLANLKVIDEVASLPIHRPLIGFEKQEIIDIAKKIGTYDLSIKSVHGCSAVPSKPATMADLNEIKRQEEKLGVENLLSETLRSVAKLSL